MTFWVAGAVVGSSLIGAQAAKSAASTQSSAADRAADLQYQQWRESTALQEPWRKAGEQALNQLIPLTNYTKFGMSQFQQDPGYQFRLSEGLKALDRQAAARGGLISGAALKAAGRYGQDYASNEYQNAFNRYQTERAAQLQPLQSLAGVGQTTATNLGSMGQSAINNIADQSTNAAAARASGYTGMANAALGGLGTYLNYNQGQNMMNMFERNQMQSSYTPTSNYSVGADYGLAGKFGG